MTISQDSPSQTDRAGRDALKDLLDSMRGARVLVIGDIMLDRFIHGDVSRISAEGPIPVLTIKRESKMLGGAGNVLSNLHGLGVQAAIIAVVGDDADAAIVEDLAAQNSTLPPTLIRDSQRPTTNKNRYLAGGQQMIRTDYEDTRPVAPDIEDRIAAQAGSFLREGDVLVLSDYGKGVLSPACLQTLIKLARTRGVTVLVDPKGSDYSRYKGADIITPNRRELSEGTGGMSVDGDDAVVEAARTVCSRHGIGAVIATRSEEGMSVIKARTASDRGHADMTGDKGFEAPVHLRTHVAEVFDVSGAGDTVVATIAAGMAAGGSITDAAVLANIAGGLAVAKVGTAIIRATDIQDSLDEPQWATPDWAEKDSGTLSEIVKAPVCTLEQACDQVARWRQRGYKIGMTNGCFDILHKGHISYLGAARHKCDRLIVGLNSDASVRLLKGDGRPLQDETSRSLVLGALGAVDMVVVFGAQSQGEDNTAAPLITALQPDIYFKGGDYTIESIPEAEIVSRYGGDVEIIPLEEGYSTTSTLRRWAKSR